MNLYELPAILSPIFGVVAGVKATHSGAPLRVAVGTAIGFAIGVVIYWSSVALGRVIDKAVKIDREEELTDFQFTLSNLTLLLPIVAPFAASAVSTMIVTMTL